MTLQKPSANTLIDQTFLGQMVDEINTLSDNFSSASSPIYNTNSKKSSLTYFGGFAFATTQLQFTHTTSTGASTRQKENFAFGKDFLVPPLVFATVQTGELTTIMDPVLSSVVVSNITNGGGTVAVTLGQAKEKKTITYYINILAVGIPKI
jgi:hypothetical protein